MTQEKKVQVPVDIKSTKLYDCGGDLSKRWRIVFKVWDFEQGKFVRKFDYDVNKYQTFDERHKFAKRFIREINEHLTKGFALNVDAVTKQKKSIKKAFLDCVEFKSLTYADRSKESITSAIDVFIKYMEVRNRANVDIDKLSKNDLIEFRDYLIKEKKITSRTVNNYVGFVNTMLNHMVERDWLSVNPFAAVKRLRQLDTLKNREISTDERELLKPALMQNKALWLFIQFVYYCWIRPGEVIHIKVKDIDLKEGRIFLYAKNTKNKRSHFVNIPEHFLKELRKLQFPSEQNKFFFAHDGQDKLFGYKQFADNRFTYYHSDIRNKLGMSEEIKMYSWKRTGVCDAYRNGVGIYHIMKHGRWQDLKEVQTYLEKSGLMLDNNINIKMPEI